MTELVFVDKYKYFRHKFYVWEHELNVLYKVLLALSFAGFTGLSAQIRIYLPFTPVPITGQVFMVLLSGVVLGKWYGGLSQSLYVGLGCLGVPWFAGMNGGYMYVIMGATGGYLIGFIVVATMCGWLTQTHIRARTLTGLLSMMLLGVLVIYLFGASYLMCLGMSFQDAILKGVLPYIPFDLAKAILVAYIGTAITTKQPYNGEVDIEQAKRWKFP